MLGFELTAPVGSAPAQAQHRVVNGDLAIKWPAYHVVAWDSYEQNVKPVAVFDIL